MTFYCARLEDAEGKHLYTRCGDARDISAAVMLAVIDYGRPAHAATVYRRADMNTAIHRNIAGYRPRGLRFGATC